MRGLDGNYLNTQGDASARMQVNYQAEINRQQLMAQLEGVESLRKLREQVNQAEKQGSSPGPRQVAEDQGSEARDGDREQNSAKRKSEKPKEESAGTEPADKATKSHIDIRV